MPLTTTGQTGHWDFLSDIVIFWMVDGKQRVRCAVTLQALEAFDPKLNRQGGADCVRCFDQHREQIERAASAKFDMGRTEPDYTITVKKEDL